jgi:hypothetical protein
MIDKSKGKSLRISNCAAAAAAAVTEKKMNKHIVWSGGEGMQRRVKKEKNIESNFHSSLTS